MPQQQRGSGLEHRCCEGCVTEPGRAAPDRAATGGLPPCLPVRSPPALGLQLGVAINQWSAVGVEVGVRRVGRDAVVGCGTRNGLEGRVLRAWGVPCSPGANTGPGGLPAQRFFNAVELAWLVDVGRDRRVVAYPVAE